MGSSTDRAAVQDATCCGAKGYHLPLDPVRERSRSAIDRDFEQWYTHPRELAVLAGATCQDAEVRGIAQRPTHD